MNNLAPIIPVSDDKCQENSWKKLLKTAFSTPKALLEYLDISYAEFLRDEKISAEKWLDSPFAMRVPLPFAQKMKKGDVDDPLLSQVIMRAAELENVRGFSDDPLQEQDTDTPGLLHKYHGRVLLILTGGCAVNCRYCFRRHFPYSDNQMSDTNRQKSLEYIASNLTISEVILSGGDPLLLNDQQLNLWVAELSKMDHIKRIRIHTRLPVVLPQRVTQRLVEILSALPQAVSIVLHINHPNELDDELGKSLAPLIAGGVILFNQSVLLKDINDDVEVLANLSEKMFKYQIVPYYLHLLDPVQGAAHFDVPFVRAKAIFAELKEKLPGYLMPKLAREEPNMRSKTWMG